MPRRSIRVQCRSPSRWHSGAAAAVNAGQREGWRAETRQLSTVLHTALAHASPATWRSAGLTSSPSPSPKKEHFPSYDLPSKVLYLHSNAQDHQVRHKAFWRGRSVGEKRERDMPMELQ